MVTWTKKTYKMVAEVLRDVIEDEKMHVRARALSRFATIFKKDNPLFDVEMFYKAGGIEDLEGWQPLTEEDEEHEIGEQE